jgi:hypothetical protein
MTDPAADIGSLKKQARFAGLLYFLNCLPAPFGLLYVPSQLIVPGDAAATANHIRAHEAMLRLGMATELFSATLAVFAVIVFYRLFKSVGPSQALAMMILFLLSVPISYLNVLNDVAALICAHGAAYLASFQPGQLDTLALFFMRLHNHGLALAQIFWGLWLFPFGVLMIRSSFVPSLPGYFLFIAGVGNLLMSCAALFFPQYGHMVSGFAPILEAGEFPMVFWFLIWGARAPRPRVPVPQAA